MPDLQPQQNSLVRVIAQDAPQMNFGTGVSPSTKAPQVQDSAAARLNDASAATQKAYDIQRSNLDSQQQTYAEKAKAVGKPQWIQDFANISDTLMKGAAVYKEQERSAKEADARYAEAVAKAAQMEDARNKEAAIEVAKQNAANQKRLQDDYYSVAADRVNNGLLDMSRMVREQGSDTGLLQTKRELDEYLNSVRDKLEPTAYRALKDKVYGELGKVDNTQTERQYEQAKSLRTSVQDQKLVEYKGRSIDSFTQLSAATSSEEVDAGMKSFNGILEAIQKDTTLNSQQKMDIQSKLYDQAIERAGNSSVALTKLTKARDANQSYGVAFEQLNQLRDEGTISENQFRALVNDLQIDASSKGVPGLNTSPLLTTDGLMKLGLDNLQVTNGLQEAAEKAANRTAADDAAKLSKAAVGNTVFQLIQNPHLIPNIKKESQPELFQAAELKKQFDNESKETQNLQNEKVKLQQEVLAAARKLDPSLKGRQSIYDPLQGVFKTVDGVPTASISPQEYDFLKQRQILIDQQIAQKTQYWASYGLNVLNPTDPSLLTSSEQIQQKTAGLQQSTGLVPSAKLPPPNPFTRATSQGKPVARPVADLATAKYQGRTLTTPFGTKNQSVADTVTSEFGMRVHPVTGGMKFHSGVDFGAPVGTPIRSINGGTVIQAAMDGDSTGFGNSIAVKTPSGHIEFFAHNSALLLKVGDVVAPGQIVSRSGQSGAGTGPHLHFTVVQPGKWNDGNVFNESNTMNPLDYMSQAVSLRAPTRTAGVAYSQSSTQLTTGKLPPGMSPLVINALRKAGIDPNNITLKPREYTVDPYTGVAAQTEGITGGRKPKYTSKGLSISKRDYPSKNDPNENYGYSELDKDPAFKKAIADTCDRLGIPAPWLLDVMRFESFNTRSGKSFDPSVVNGIGATGLIQFMPETARGLGTSTAALSRMSRVEQMKYVEKYFEDVKGRMKHPGDVLAKIFIGNIEYSEAKRENMGDGGTTYGKYKRSLGEFAGRSYKW